MIKQVLIITASIFMAILLFSISAVPILAFDARSGPDVTIPGGEIIDGDLYIAGTNITINGTVNGDIFAAGQNISINGTVNGGVSLAGQTITLNGTVSSGTRIAGQNITIGGKIGRDLVVAGSDVIINNSAVIGKDLNSYAGSTIINGRVTGNVTGSINNLTISDGIGGSVIVTTNTLLITSNANIVGNLNYTSNNVVTIQSGAIIAGATNRIIPPKNEPARGALNGLIGGFIFRIFALLGIFIIGLVIIFMTRKQIASLAFAIHDHPASSLGWGALLFFVTPIAAIVVMFTLIGIPLSLVSLFTWGILLYVSQIPVALLLGWLILSRRRDNLSHGLLIGFLALGLAIIYIISAIPIIGWIIVLLVMIFGLGSLIAMFRSRQKTNQINPVQ